MKTYIAEISVDGETLIYLIRAKDSIEARQKAKGFCWDYPPKKFKVKSVETLFDENRTDVVLIAEKS